MNDKIRKPKSERPARCRAHVGSRRSAFTLIEVLVAVILLTLMMLAITRLYALSRSVTERSRDWAEYYAITRQEAERSKATTFNGLFIAAGNVYSSANNPLRTDYDERGNLLATNLAANASPTNGAYYRAVSTYALVSTGTETLAARKLGVQVIQVYRKSTATAFEGSPVFQTTVFHTAPGV